MGHAFFVALFRVDMEELCAHLFQRVEKTLRRCLEDSSEYSYDATIMQNSPVYCGHFIIINQQMHNLCIYIVILHC